ncbi:MAG: WD40 repeat domain-containing protein [Anaerolineales bacterium]
MIRVASVLLCLVLLVAACEDDGSPSDENTPPTPLTVEWERPTNVISPQNANQLRIGGILNAHTSTVFAMHAAANGQRVATSGGDERLVVWNIASGRPLMSISGVIVPQVLLPDDGESVIGLTNNAEIFRWSLQDGSLLAEARITSEAISAAVLSPNSARLAVGTTDGWITLWDTATLDRIARFAAYPGGSTVQGLYYAPEDDILYSVGGNGEVLAWNSLNQELLRTLQDDETVLASASSPDGTRLALAQRERLNVYDTRSGTPINQFDIPPFGAIYAMEISQDNAWIALGGNIDSVTIFDLSSGELVVALREHGANFGDLALSPDRSMIVTALDGGVASVWDLRSFLGADIPATQVEVDVPRARLTQIPNLRNSALVWSPEGQYILLADRSGPVYMLHVP